MSTRHDDSRQRSLLRGGAESATVWLVLGKTARAMTTATDTLPDNLDALRALILAERAAHAAVVAERATIRDERDQLTARNAQLESTTASLQSVNAKLEDANARLEAIVAEIRRAHFGRKSERISADQLALALEEFETAAAKVEAEADKSNATPQSER
jgi:transposase